MRRALILGTGTGVGKTYVTAALARALARSGADVRARKPVETGIAPPSARRRGPPAPTDAATLDAVSSLPAPRPHPLFAFRQPVSPHLAARAQKVRISVPRIRSWLDADDQRRRSDMTTHAVSWQLVETAGGLFSPLGRRTTNLDLALALDASVWILVAHDGLGVLHDVRATLLALRSLTPRAPDYLVLSQSRAADASTGTNARELPRLGLPAPIAVVTSTGRAEAELAPLVRALMKRS